MEHGGVTHVRGAVDADRPRGRLADGDDVGELGVGEPMVLDYSLVVDKREHGIATSEVEGAYLREYEE